MGFWEFETGWPWSMEIYVFSCRLLILNKLSNSVSG